MIRPGINVLGRPSIGISPFVAPNIPQTNFSIGDNGLIQTAPNNDSKRPDLVQEETKLPKSVNFLADHSGCGFWRMFWPADQLNSRVESVVMSSCQMIHDELFFSQLKTVRIQRQATENQHRYVTYLEKMREKFNFNLVYEIDDIMYYEDIPEYNKFKPGFSDPKIAEFCSLIMMTCDEITTTNKFIADYYAEKSGNKNVTVIPNYPPKWWIGNYYDEKKISQNFDKNRNKPRILYAGSGAHIDVEGRCKYKDDFYHILDVVRKTVDQYQWVFFGAVPIPLLDLYRSGKIEFHQWTKLYDFPEKIASLNCQIMIAPLQDNTFNRGKSDIKLIEAGAFGAPCICQDIVTYKEADYKFTSGDDLIDQIKKLVKSKDEFMRASRKHRARSERRFLECPENLGKWKELYHYKYGAPERKLINELNGIA
jgi:hypothetical protein